MPAANHSYYLRNCYLENRLSTGSMVLDNTLLDLSKVKVPVYNLATREDHIAPADSVLYGSQFFGGPVQFVLAGSGHIAGVVNPPSQAKYQFWTNDKIKDVTLSDWLKGAQEHKGSWWPHWREWLESIDAERVPARAVGNESMPPTEDAPGSYVRVRA
jgi:polyhydroxyalkanoate synthase